MRRITSNNSTTDFWDDDDLLETEQEILVDSMIKIKKTYEYKFGEIKLIHTNDEESKKSYFRIITKNNNDEFSESDAVILANIIQDIFKKKEEGK